MTAKIKICGVTRIDDAAYASTAGADFIGINFWPSSKRYVVPDRAGLIAAAARGAGETRIVGVFVDADRDDLAAIVRDVDLDIIQLHGDESPHVVAAMAAITNRPVWKAISVDSTRDVESLDVWPAEAIVLDARTPNRGGGGASFDWAIAAEARRRYPERRFVLAGGLRADNVAEAIAAVQPWAVDVASGVETSPGIKDAVKIAAFVAAVRADCR